MRSGNRTRLPHRYVLPRHLLRDGGLHGPGELRRPADPGLGNPVRAGTGEVGLVQKPLTQRLSRKLVMNASLPPLYVVSKASVVVGKS